MSHSCKCKPSKDRCRDRCHQKREQKFCCEPVCPPICPPPVAAIGAIAGTVTDLLAGAPIAGVAVSIARATAPLVPIATTTTNASGQYAVLLPAPGLYIVTFAAGTSACTLFVPNLVPAPVFPNQTTTVDSVCTLP